jgi:hypothetical protein
MSVSLLNIDVCTVPPTVAAFDSIKGLDARQGYCREVMEEATRLVGWTFFEQNCFVSISPAADLETTQRHSESISNEASEVATTIQ